jgi:uncharacterized protein (DUF342 family)
MELQHHGILGQKWGKRNGPPYPLTPQQYTKAERKFEKRLSKLDKKIILVEDRQRKARKNQIKADKKKYGVFKSTRKAIKYQVKAEKEQYKAEKQMNKIAKEVYKISKQFDEKYSGLFEVPDKYVNIGKRYADQMQYRTISSMSRYGY